MTEQLARLKTALAGRYTIEREIGSGGMATVYLADDLKHRRSVAIKVLKPEVAVALGPERFLREIAIAARLNHPHILALHDSGEAAGFLYYVAPYVEGKSLRERLAHQKQLAIEEALQIAEQVAAALDYAHRQGVVHRDIKPENILLHEGSALIADFGIALAISAVGQERLTHSGFSVGTPEYMSPEQACGEPDLDGRSDVYSLGCLLYEMLAGEPPYAGPTAQAVIAKCLADRVPSVRRLRDNIAPHVDAALIRALAKVPSERFGCAGDFIAALTRAATGAARSIAVLPFANLSPDPDNEYFSDGITEDIITRLSKIAALKVISRTSVMRFKNTTKSMREIAAALDVSTVLEGSVRRVGARVRVTAQLIDAGSDEHLWADTYDRQLTDVFAIQSEVAEAIAIALHARLSSVEETRVRQRDAIDPETYRLCLVGRHHWNRWTEEDFAKSRAAYDAAIARDPACALAHAGLGQTLQTLSLGYWSVPGRPFFAPAKAALERALALDPELAEAHVWLAYATMQHDYDWVLAKLKVQRALAVAPNSSAAHDVHGNILAATGRHTESRKAYDRAVDLDPLSQFILANAALCAHRGRDYDRALAFWERMITLDPDHHMGRLLGSLTLTAVGRVDEGLVSARRARSILGPLADPTLANACAAAGRADEARDILARCEARRRSQHGWPFPLAMGYARLGEIDTAFARLQEAYAERDFWMVWLGVQPELDPLRADPRYHALLRQVNLAGGPP